MQPLSLTRPSSYARHAWSRHLLDGTFVAVSPAALDVYRAPPEKLIGGRLSSLVAPEDAADAERALDEAARGDDAVSFVVRLSGGDVPRWIEIAAHADSRGPGEVELRCVARDAGLSARSVAEQIQISSKADALGRRLERLIAGVPGVVWETWFVEDPARQRISFVSERSVAMNGYTPAEWLSDRDFWLKVTHPDDRPAALANSARLYEEGSGSSQSRWITKDGRVIWVEAQMQVMRNDDGSPAGLCGVSMDITARKLAEQEQARLREEVIQSQARLLAELSTPLIPLGEGVVAVPLVGSLDRARVDRVVETLLRGISASRARFAILDITGVPTVDAEVADALLRAARSVQLLGAQVVLTGIRPEVAQTLVTLGTTLTGIVTRGTLEDGIRYAARGQ